MALLKQSTVYNRAFLMVLTSDHITGATGKTVTVNLSKAAAAFGAAAGAITEISAGWYKVALTTGDTGTLGDLAFDCTASACDNTDFCDQVIAVDFADSVRAGLTALPNAAAAAASGLPVLGTNATAISFTAGMTISSTTGNALALTSSGGNGDGLAATGNGSGHGIHLVPGATGNGLLAIGGATSGTAIKATGTAGNAIALELAGQGSAAGLSATGGATGIGITAVGGATSGTAIKATGSAGNAIALELVGQGSAAGLSATGGATGIGITAVGGATSGSGLKAIGTAGNAIALEIAGQGSAAGIQATGGATGSAFKLVGGGTSGHGLAVTTTAGDGFNLTPTAGNAITATANGTSKHGIVATGGTAGTSDGASFIAGTGGVDFRANQTGNVTGNLSGSVGSVTGAVGSVTGAVGSVTGAVGSVTARVTANTDQWAGTVIPAPAVTGVPKVDLVDIAGATVSTSTAQLGVNAVQIGAAVPGSATIGTVTTTTTATNLTNAPTAGDFTAAMKTSLNAATPASVTGAVASVTGNVGGNVVGSVASVTAGVTVTTNNDKTGYTLTNPGANPTGSVVADGGNSATTFVTDRTETVDNYWNDALLLITSGVLIGQVKKITGYSGTTKAVTVLTGFTAAPATSVTFQLVNR